MQFPLLLKEVELFDKDNALRDVNCSINERGGYLEFKDEESDASGRRSPSGYAVDLFRSMPLIGYLLGNCAVGRKQVLLDACQLVDTFLHDALDVLSAGDPDECGYLYRRAEAGHYGQYTWIKIERDPGESEMPVCSCAMPIDIQNLFSYANKIQTWHAQRLTYVPRRLFISRLAWIFSTSEIYYDIEWKKKVQPYEFTQATGRITFTSQLEQASIKFFYSSRVDEISIPLAIRLNWDDVLNPVSGDHEGQFKTNSIQVESSLAQLFFHAKTKEEALTALIALILKGESNDENKESNKGDRENFIHGLIQTYLSKNKSMTSCDLQKIDSLFKAIQSSEALTWRQKQAVFRTIAFFVEGNSLAQRDGEIKRQYKCDLILFYVATCVLAPIGIAYASDPMLSKYLLNLVNPQSASWFQKNVLLNHTWNLGTRIGVPVVFAVILIAFILWRYHQSQVNYRTAGEEILKKIVNDDQHKVENPLTTAGVYNRVRRRSESSIGSDVDAIGTTDTADDHWKVNPLITAEISSEAAISSSPSPSLTSSRR